MFHYIDAFHLNCSKAYQQPPDFHHFCNVKYYVSHRRYWILTSLVDPIVSLSKDTEAPPEASSLSRSIVSTASKWARLGVVAGELVGAGDWWPALVQVIS